LNGFESIERGSLIAANCSQLVEVSAPDLVLNYGNITLSNLPLLKALDFPRLEYVEGTLLWDSLPLLTNINFGSLAPSGGYYSYGDLNISNTGCKEAIQSSSYVLSFNRLSISCNCKESPETLLGLRC
jgi:hypothetical protein